MFVSQVEEVEGLRRPINAVPGNGEDKQSDRDEISEWEYEISLSPCDLKVIGQDDVHEQTSDESTNMGSV
jgi:hypothetical protein